MADQDSQDRHLPASARKLRKAREDGQVARSRDLSHFAVIAPAAAWLRTMLAAALQFDARVLLSTDSMGTRLTTLALPALAGVVMLGLAVALLAAAAGVFSGGWVWSWKALAPKFERLNPIAGLPRIASGHQLTETLKACVLALVLGGLGATYLWGHAEAFIAVQAQALPAAFAQVGSEVLWGLVWLVVALALFAALDVPLQRFMHARRLRMSHQEAKQEHKELEGSPEIKGRQRSRMREVAKRRMLAAVPGADLVVMNPTHYAVALKYDEASMAAPRVVARGADLLALRIRDAAKAAKVPVLQAPPLARALYAHAELDRDIPLALFSAVAQVLAYVYQLRAALTGRVPMPLEPADVPVPAELDPHHKAAAA
jgi:flagellar biosynthesis protein FlhB